MALVKIDLRPKTVLLQRFGCVALLAFALLGAWILWRGGLFGADFGASGPLVAWILFGLGALSGLFSLAAPRANLPLYLLLTIVGAPIGFVVSWVVLTFLWVGVVTPLGLLMRATGKDPLRRRFDPAATTYFETREGEPPLERYFKQF